MEFFGNFRERMFKKEHFVVLDARYQMLDIRTLYIIYMRDGVYSPWNSKKK